MADLANSERWLPVIGKALAQLCLEARKGSEMTIAEKAQFLEGLGLDRKDVAEMLGTTYASISELLRQAKKKKGKGRGGKSKQRR